MRALTKIKNMLLGPVVNNQSGETLLSLLVSLAVALVLIYQVNNVVQRTIANRLHINLRKSKNDLKRMILQTMDCKSFNYACTNGSSVALRNFDGEILVDNPDSTYGRWTVRATCHDNTPEVRFALEDPANPGDFLKDPKTDEIMNWSQPVAVPRGELCRSQPNPMQIVIGDRCDRDARIAGTQTGALTGAPPSSPWFEPPTPANICNPNGDDGDVPNCPSGTNEWYRYWDRDDDWGKSGSWVVACR